MSLVNAIIRIAIYIRVSTDMQEDSPDRQLAMIEQYLERKYAGRMVIVDRYIDLNRKGWTDERPEFQRLLRDAAAGKLDLILVDQGSRLSRQNPVEFCAKVAYPLQQAGVKVESVQQGRPLDWNNIGDFIVQGVDQFQSNKESANIGWRVLGEWCLKAEKADLYLGPTPYAYKKVRKEDGLPYFSHLPKETRGTPTLVKGDEREVAVIRFIFDAYGNQGMTLSEIVKELKARGVPSPTGGDKWRRSTINRWLRDTIYLGTYRFNVTHSGKFYRRTKDGLVESDKPKDQWHSRNPKEDWIVKPENHEALIDNELFQRVQDRLAENKRRGTTPGGKRQEFLLSGLLACGQCKARMTGNIPKRAGKAYPVVYRCTNGYDKGDCLPRTIKESEILQHVLREIQKFASPEVLNKLREKARTELERACKPTNLDTLNTEKAQLAKQIDRARRNLSLLEDEDDVRAVQADIKVWKDRVRQIDDLLQEAQSPTALKLLEEAIKEMERLVWDLQEASKDTNPRKLRLLFSCLIKRIEVNTQEKVIGKNRHIYEITGGAIYLKSGSALSGQAANGLLNLSQGDSSTVQ